MHDTKTFRLFQSSLGPIATWLLRRASLLTFYKEDYSIGGVVVRVEKMGDVTQNVTLRCLCVDSLHIFVVIILFCHRQLLPEFTYRACCNFIAEAAPL